jgi:hypothetical protein
MIGPRPDPDRVVNHRARPDGMNARFGPDGPER